MTDDTSLPPKLDDLVKGVKHWIARFSAPVIKLENYEWEGDDDEQFYEFLIRSVIRRQYEAVVATVKMTEGGFGFFAVTLLRPAYEEMVWLAYLKQHPALAKELVVLLMRKELCDNIEAQNDYLKTNEMAAVGFTQKYVKHVLAQNKPHLARLREIGRSLKWREGAMLPPFAFVARQVKRDKEYNYLYQATSRFVHFPCKKICVGCGARRARLPSLQVISLATGAPSRCHGACAFFWIPSCTPMACLTVWISMRQKPINLANG